MLASAGIILSSVTMVAPIAVPITISAISTIAGVATAITKKISSCSQSKLREYIYKYNTAVDASTKLSTLISSSVDDNIITDAEFSAISLIYNSAMSKLEKFVLERDNNNNVVTGSTPTNSIKYKTDTNKHDINNINETRI